MSQGSSNERRNADGRPSTVRRRQPPEITITTTNNADSVTFFGMWSPVILFPIILIGTNEARCAYCVCLLVALLLTDALSPQVIALLPFVLFLDRSVDDHPLYFKIPMQILHELAMVLMVASVDATSLLCRTALYAVSLFGTRVRTLLCLCLTGAVLFTLLMNGTAAVLIMAAIADNMVQLLQNDLVQVFQQRALFEKATVGLSSLRRRLLQDILWPRRFGDREPATTPAGNVPSPALSASSDETTMRLIQKLSSAQQGARHGADIETIPKLANPKYANSWVLDFLIDTNVADDQLVNHEMSRASAPVSTDSAEESPPRHSPPKQPTVPNKSSLLSLPRQAGRRKKTSILEDGQVVIPGQSSPEHKPVKGINPYHRVQLPPTFQRYLLQQIIAWKKERYHIIHNQLLMGVVVASSLSSMLSRVQGSVQRDVIGYLESRFQRSIMSNAIWWIMLFPAEMVGLAAFWLRLKCNFLSIYDAPEDQQAQIAIHLLIENLSRDIGLFRHPELVPTTVLLTWVMAHSLNVLDWRGPYNFVDYHEHLDFDYLGVILVFSIPWVQCYLGRPVDFRKVARRLPWGAFFLYLSSLQLGFVTKEFGLAAWITKRMTSIPTPNLLLSQSTLAVCSALLTELTGDDATTSLLMPIVVELAVSNQCHPLYFAIPVLVGASTSVIFPVGSMALALLYSITDLGARDMMVAGLMTKVASIAITLLTANTVGYYIFEWNVAPPWLDGMSTSATATNRSHDIDPQLM
ncbi:uncharacterized protein LOC144122882 [Amblyomma americanum]